jgi:ABC-type nitrate/sulfonate/bicarbonate transport system substrate-binding protein
MTFLRRLASAVAALALTLPLAAQAQGLTKIRFSLDWKFEGQTSFFHMAKIKGYFEQEGLDVTIDSGNGSAAGIQRIASGAYDIVLADISALIEYTANNPGPTRMQAVYLLYDQAPLAYFTLKKSGIASIAGLQGRSIAAAPFEVTRKMWPVIAKAAKIDPATVKWVTIDPALRANTVIKGDADASSGFLNANLEYYARGIKPDELAMFPVADLGLKLYGNAVIASSKLIAENPRAVAAFVKVANRAFREGLADPATSVRFLKQREPLADEKLELTRFELLMPAMLTERTRSGGLGALSKLDLENQVDYVTEAFSLKTRPNPDLLFNSSFLPSRAERMPLAPVTTTAR